MNKTVSPSSLSDGLTGHWTFDGKDMTQNVADISGNGYNGYLTGFTSTTTTIGKVGQALQFDGVDDYVNTNTIVTNFFSADTGTISAWLRPTAAALDKTTGLIYSAPPVVSSSAVVASFGIVQANNTDLGQDRIWAFNYVSSPDIVGATYNVGEWIHITWLHSGGTLSIYKNGEFVDSIASGDTVNFSGILQIGTNWSVVPGWWNGDIDEVRTYNRALSANEIKQLYDSTKGSVINKTASPGNLSDGLVGHWTFDGPDMVSNIADISGNSNHGALQGQTSTTTVIGKIGQALDFDGVDDGILVPDSNSLDIGTNDMSISGWIKTTDKTFNTLLEKQLNSTRYVIVVATSGALRFMIEDVLSGQISAFSNNVADGEWHHFVVVADRDANATWYVDGVIDGTPVDISSAPGDLSNGADLGIATNDLATGNYLDTTLDDFRIYNRLLTPAEITQLYNMGI